MFAKFFIDRPRFAMVVCFVMAVAGVIAGFSLPVKQYPDVAPPQIVVEANYPGADAETLANTVGVPIEEAINGVEDVIYMDSTSDNTGRYQLSVTFKTGSDSDMAMVRVQNRVQQAMPLLPSEVTSRGVTTESRFSNTLAFIALISPNGTRDSLFLNDYATNNIAKTLQRIPGMGSVEIMGSEYSMRIWLDPERLLSLGLTTSDVAAAISSQNRQATLGSAGAAPSSAESLLIYSLTTRGRLGTVKEFEEIILRTTDGGGLVKLRDVSRIELGRETYIFDAAFNGVPSSMMMLSQGNDSNALELMGATNTAIEDLKRYFPEDVECIVGYDTTDYVRETIKEILQTLVLTFSLVVFVCYIFLQDWRSTLVPVAAIPISLMATFAGLAALGFSINILTLFAFVLVIGTVVDDAIIVVERCIYVMERDKLNSYDAAVQAMKDVTGPMTATTLVFLAIFVPVAFMGGMTGIIYRQFAVTVSFSVMFSLVVALTLSPAMCAYMLKDIKPKTRGPLAWFNDMVSKSTRAYVAGSMWIARRTIVTLGLLVLVVGMSMTVIKITPTEFVPDEDQGVAFMAMQLPEGSSTRRTQGVLDKLTPQIRDIPGVRFAMNVAGYNIMGGSGENVGSVIVALDSWSERKTKETSLASITGQLRRIAAETPEAQINIFTPPPISGLGTAGGLDIRLQSRIENDPERLAQVLSAFIGKILQSPEFSFAFSNYTADTPHMYLNIDRDKAEMYGVPISSIYSTMGTYFGTAYINDINIGTQVNKVILQSDWPYRSSTDSIASIFVPSARGGQVPLQSVVTLEKTLAPRSIARFNLYPAASITAATASGYSSGQGIARIEQLKAELPVGYTIEYAGQTYQEREAGGQIVLIIAISLLFGYLFLVAQYESWSVPLGVILSLPVAMLGALIGIFIMRITLSIYTQLGMLLLIGLSAKNAILIIEFAKEQHEEHGHPIIQAAAIAASERFRSVMMTALTCVIGVLPMLFASGAGAGSRLHVGTSMFFGMSISTGLGIFLIPGLYVFLQTYREKIKARLASSFRKKKTEEQGA